jgi:hypothetical protein
MRPVSQAGPASPGCLSRMGRIRASARPENDIDEALMLLERNDAWSSPKNNP